MNTLTDLKDRFPGLSNGWARFDGPAGTQVVDTAIEAMSEWQRSGNNANSHGFFPAADACDALVEQVSNTMGQLLGANPEGMIFGPSTTANLMAVTRAVGKTLSPEDEIICTTLDHSANVSPWQIAAEKKGAVIKEIPINEKGEILLEEYEKLLGPKTKIVSVTHTSNALGTINPIEEMIPMAHKVGSIFMVDAAQAVAHNSLNVKDLNCDFLAFSSHKIFGPTGVGVLYGKEELLNKMPPYQGGGEMIDKVTFKKTTFNELPFKFEAGTPHIAGVIALKSALDYVQEVGLENIANYEQELLDYATEKLQKVEGLKIVGTSKRKASVLSFVMEGIHPQDIGSLLDKQGIAIRTGHHCTQPLMDFFNISGTARASLCFYNTKEEIDAFINGLHKVKEFF